MAALPGAPQTVRNHYAHVAWPGQHGRLPRSNDRHHHPRPEPLGVRPTLDSGPEQWGRHRGGVPVDRGPAASAHDDTCRTDPCCTPNARTPIRDDRDRRFRGNDGGPSSGAVPRISRPASRRRAGTPGRCAQRLAPLPRDDGDPRQGCGRRATRASTGYGIQPVAVSRARTVAVA
jgi:hypothetical protein